MVKSKEVLFKTAVKPCTVSIVLNQNNSTVLTTYVENSKYSNISIIKNNYPNAKIAKEAYQCLLDNYLDQGYSNQKNFKFNYMKYDNADITKITYPIYTRVIKSNVKFHAIRNESIVIDDAKTSIFDRVIKELFDTINVDIIEGYVMIKDAEVREYDTNTEIRNELRNPNSTDLYLVVTDAPMMNLPYVKRRNFLQLIEPNSLLTVDMGIAVNNENDLKDAYVEALESNQHGILLVSPSSKYVYNSVANGAYRMVPKRRQVVTCVDAKITTRYRGKPCVVCTDTNNRTFKVILDSNIIPNQNDKVEIEYTDYNSSGTPHRPVATRLI